MVVLLIPVLANGSAENCHSSSKSFFLSLCKSNYNLVIPRIGDVPNNLKGVLHLDPCLLTVPIWVGMSWRSTVCVTSESIPQTNCPSHSLHVIMTFPVYVLHNLLHRKFMDLLELVVESSSFLQLLLLLVSSFFFPVSNVDCMFVSNLNESFSLFSVSWCRGELKQYLAEDLVVEPLLETNRRIGAVFGRAFGCWTSNGTKKIVYIGNWLTIFCTGFIIHAFTFWSF